MVLHHFSFLNFASLHLTLLCLTQLDLFSPFILSEDFKLRCSRFELRLGRLQLPCPSPEICPPVRASVRGTTPRSWKPVQPRACYNAIFSWLPPYCSCLSRSYTNEENTECRVQVALCHKSPTPETARLPELQRLHAQRAMLVTLRRQDLTMV